MSLRLAILLVLTGWPVLAAGAELRSSATGNVFVAGEPVAVTLLHANGNKAHWVLRDFFGKDVAAGDAVVSGGSAVIRLPPGILGYFTLGVAQDREPADQAQTALTVIASAKTSPASSPFGVVTHFAKDWPTDVITLIEKAGIRRVRDEQPWRKIEKQTGRYEFPPLLGGYMTELAAHDIDPLIELVFSNPLYDGDKTPFSDQGRAGYAAYGRAVVQHYGAQIGAVEIWNEYNGSFCDGPCRSDRPGFYTKMLKQTYGALKAARPDLTVAGGAAVPVPLDYFEALFRDGALDAMDAVVIHPYRKDPEGVEEKIDQLRQLMQRYGKVKPIWATEFSDLGDMRKNRDDVARYLVKMSTLLLAAKVDRIYWYLMKDYQEFTGLGLVRSESDPLGRYVATPAYAAYAALIHQLGSAHFVRREASDPQSHIYLFSDGAREIRVAWSDAASATYQPPAGGPVQEIDLMGNARDVPATKGRVSITLDGNPVYLIGDVSRAH